MPWPRSSPILAVPVALFLLASTARADATSPSADEPLLAPPQPAKNLQTPSNDWLFASLELRGIVALNALSLVGSFTDTGRPPSSIGLGALTSHDVVTASGDLAWSTRAHLRGSLGGGQAGFDGRLAALVTVGPSFGKGLIAFTPRLGLNGEIRGNDRLSRSTFAVPRLDLALDVHPFKRLFFELGVSGAYGLIDRLSLDRGNSDRPSLQNDGSWQAGPFVAAGYRVVTLTVQTQRSFASRSFDTWDAHACWNAVSVVTLCSSYTGARVARDGTATNATNATNEAVRSAHMLQLSVGYGAVEAW